MSSKVKFAISLAASFSLAAALVISAPAAKRHPTLRLVSDNPVTVVGRGFARGERVVLRTMVNGGAFKKTVRANSVGAFRTQLAEVDAQCSPFQISAVGARGSVTSTQRIRIPEACGMVTQP
jgi:hypothetical protein